MNNQPAPSPALSQTGIHGTGAWDQPSGSEHSGIVVEEALQMQERLWGLGERIRVEELLAHQPEWQANDSLVLELIYQEAILREEAGEPGSLREYQERFPSLAEALHIQWEIDQILVSKRQSRNERGQTPKNSKLPPQIDRYNVLEMLGKGGMGIAYKAWERIRPSKCGMWRPVRKSSLSQGIQMRCGA